MYSVRTYREVGVGGRSPVLERRQVVRSRRRFFLVVRPKINCSIHGVRIYGNKKMIRRTYIYRN